MIIITKKLHPAAWWPAAPCSPWALGVLGAGLGLVRDIQSAAAVADLQVDPGASKPTPTGWPFWRATAGSSPRSLPP